MLAVLCGGLAGVGGLSFDGAFELGGIWRMGLACAAAPALIAALGLIRKSRPLPLGLTLGLSFLAWLAVPLLAAALAAPGSGSPGGWLAILRAAVTDAPKQLLTTEPPVVPSAVLLAGLGTLVWWAAAWSAEAAVRAATAGRTSIAAAVPGLVVLLAGTAAGIPRGSATAMWPTVAFTFCFVLILAVQKIGASQSRSRASSGGFWAAAGRTLLVLGSAVAITAVGVLGVPVLPGLAGRPPADPRALIKPVSHVQPLLDPLGLATAWLSGKPRLLFTVRTASPVNLDWLVLDRYDGQQWLADGDYVPAGSVLPPEPGVAVTGRHVVADVRVTGLPGTWLPAADRPVRLSGAAVRVDPVSGMLATLNGSAARGLSYRVTSSVPALGAHRLADAVPGSGPGVAAERALPAGLPARVAQFGTRAMAGAASPYQQMLALQNRMLHDFRYNPRAAPGESYGLLYFFVGQHHVGGPGVFATLFAVLARRAGFASRIAVGFLPGRRIGPGVYAVTTADVLIWPEVYFRGLGWVPFYPLPRPGSGKNGAAIRPLGQPSSRTKLDKRLQRSQPSGRGFRHPGKRRGVAVVRSAGGVSVGRVMLICMGVLLAVGLLYLGLAAFLRLSVRRRWRRGAGPRGLVSGAWQSALSGLTAAGGADLSTLTPEEVVEHAVVVAGSSAREPVAVLADLVNTALFSPAEPAVSAAEAAVTAAGQVRRLARKRTSVRARGVSLLRPVPPGFERPATGSTPRRRWRSPRWRRHPRRP
ncbi:MAG TPA: transglutaminaseTgpA domain-containing protein [Streptosporangiaceae bacterium]|nr:transglutaminaseTgpA domain-containing protein [Streptosporangiaceae bacterium]